MLHPKPDTTCFSRKGPRSRAACSSGKAPNSEPNTSSVPQLCAPAPHPQSPQRVAQPQLAFLLTSSMETLTSTPTPQDLLSAQPLEMGPHISIP